MINHEVNTTYLSQQFRYWHSDIVVLDMLQELKYGVKLCIIIVNTCYQWNPHNNYLQSQDTIVLSGRTRQRSWRISTRASRKVGKDSVVLVYVANQFVQAHVCLLSTLSTVNTELSVSIVFKTNLWQNCQKPAQHLIQQKWAVQSQIYPQLSLGLNESRTIIIVCLIESIRSLVSLSKTLLRPGQKHV